MLWYIVRNLVIVSLNFVGNLVARLEFLSPSVRIIG